VFSQYIFGRLNSSTAFSDASGIKMTNDSDIMVAKKSVSLSDNTEETF
jgi:hypothetical protein